MSMVSPDDVSVTDVKGTDSINPQESEYSFNDGLKTLGSAGEVLTRVDLDLAYSSEKFLNLDILLMHVADRAVDLEGLVIDNDFSGDSAEKALEFDVLSGILHSEVKELNNFMIALQEEITDAREKISTCEHLKEAFAEMEEKLHDSEESLKQLQFQVSEMRMQSTKFQSAIVFGGLSSWNSGISEISHLSSMHAKMKMQTTEQQRHILKMLEKSLARELDLEKWLSESRHNEEELKLKLHFAEQDMEEMTDLILERLFEAESFTEVLTGISKELTGKLQIGQFNLNSSLKREGDMKARLQVSMHQLSTKDMELEYLKANLKKAEHEYDLSNSEAIALREKVVSLEEKLREFDIHLQEEKASVEASQVQRNMLDSKIIDLEKLIEDLSAKVFKMESRAESAETQCKVLTEANSKLAEQLSSLNSSEIEKASSFEKQLRQSETQLQHAKASIEASQEQQSMLLFALDDMENLIEDLKTKALKAEGRADSAEAKCNLLTEMNLELNEELGSLRGRVECLEMSLRQADDVKMEIAKDIGIRTKVISDLVIQLAVERQRLHTQISSLTKENKILVETLWKTRNDTSVTVSHNENSSEKESVYYKNDSATAQCPKSFEESVTESSATSLQVDKFAKAEVGPTVSALDSAGVESKLRTVRTIKARQFNLIYVFMAVLFLLISMAAVYLFQKKDSHFNY